MTGMSTLSGLLAYAAWTALAYAMDRHYADMHGRGKEPSVRRRTGLRLAGSFILVLSFGAAVSAAGWHIGPVLWCGLLTLAGISVALLLQYAPRLAMLTGGACLIVAPVLVLALRYAK